MPEILLIFGIYIAKFSKSSPFVTQKNIAMGSSPSFLDPVVLPLLRGKHILDIACGFGRWGCLMRTNFFEWGLSEFPIVDGIDGDKGCVQHCRGLGVYREVKHAIVPTHIPPRSYDTVLASEVIEHVSKDEIIPFLDFCEKTARYRVVITTPNFECIRGGSDSPLGFNELDHHQCYVSQDFLKQRGYSILGAGFNASHVLWMRCILRLMKLLRLNNFSCFLGLSIAIPKLAHTTIAYKVILPFPDKITTHAGFNTD